MKEGQNIATFFDRHPELRIEEDVLENLIAQAVGFRERAYAPYSHYKVGAAILCQSGGIYGGCNVENVSYTPTTHAEEVAVTQAVIAGEIEKSGRRFLKALVVVHEGDSMPCGLCRQVIKEFCDDCLVINAKPDGEILGIASFSELFPRSFSPTHLGIE